MTTIDPAVSAAVIEAYNNSEIGQFHAAFDSMVRSIMEPVRDNMVITVPDTGLALSENSVIAQVLMNVLAEDQYRGGYNPETGKFTTAQKARFVEMADWMGPDWAQALYHAAVFITKVA